MLKMLKNLRKQDLLVILISSLFIVSQVYLDLKVPDYMAEITRLVQTPGSAIHDIWVQGSYMLLCTFGSIISSIIVGFFAARLAASFAMRLRTMIFEKTIGFSMEEINKFSTASLITRSTNDITQIQSFVAMGMQIIIKSPILAVWAITKINNNGNWQWSLAVTISVLFLMVIIISLIFTALPKFKIIQKLTDNLNKVTRENLTGIRVVRAYNAEDYQEEKFEKANQDLTKTNLFTNRMMGIMMPSMNLVMSSLSLIIYWIGAYLISNSATMPEKLGIFSNMVVFSAYAVQVIMAFMMLTMIFVILPRVSVSANRIMAVLETESKIKDGKKVTTKSEIPKGKGTIEFKNVYFKYPESTDYVLEDINFKINQGETLAIIGATGSGKSSLINLIPRFYDASKGEVLIDGINVKDYSQELLNNKLGYVSQKSIIFSGDIKSNIAYGENGKEAPSIKEIAKAMDIAQGTELVLKKDDGFDSHVSQGGGNLSGGQKQRVSIARAICRSPEVYIFDDSFSALDYKTDKMLRLALKKETGSVTSIIVAQRIGTIKEADQILVIDKGKIVGIGKHKDLLNNCNIYREIALSQLSEEELKNA